jgi:hypothetical protein
VENLVETSVRFSRGTLGQLKLLAHLRSIESGTTVTWNGLVRECVEKHLLGGVPVTTLGRPPAVAGR